MADQIRGPSREPSGSAEAPAAIQPEPTGAARRTPVDTDTPQGMPRYEDPEQARHEIEATRARMSETIDEIEESLIRKRERIQNRMDIMAPVRESPWQAMGIALGAGLLLGFLTGGGDGDDEEVRRAPRRDRDRLVEPDWERRAAILDGRTRRLVRIARQQEEELERLQADRGHRPLRRRVREFGGDTHVESGGGADDDQARTPLDEIRDAILRQVTSYLGRAVRQFAMQR